MKRKKAKKFCEQEYNNIGFTGKWAEHFGNPEWKSTWIVFGKSGSGKTEFAVQLAKYMSEHGRVEYVSSEQADSSGLQKAWKRNAMDKCNNVYLVYDTTKEDIFKLIKMRGRHTCIVIDSIDYSRISVEDYKQMAVIANRKHKMLVFVSWAEGKEPKTQDGKDIQYMADMPIWINKYVAENMGRHKGINQKYVIWYEGAKEHHAFLNRSL